VYKVFIENRSVTSVAVSASSEAVASGVPAQSVENPLICINGYLEQGWRAKERLK